jgi:hypothetical protein
VSEQGAEAPQQAQEATQNTEPETVEGATQESKTFDADYVRQLRAEAAKHRKEAQEARSKVEQFENRDKSELEKAQTKAQKLEAEKAQAEARLLRYEVATEKNVPAKLVPLLTAATREELEAQAALILETAKPEQTPDFDGGAREPAPAAQSPEQAHDAFITALISGKSP